MERNDVASFFYYMWNAWCKSECEIAFAGYGVAEHLWGKWVSYCEEQRTSMGASEKFFANLSESYQDMLVKRAIEVYSRRERIE